MITILYLVCYLVSYNFAIVNCRIYQYCLDLLQTAAVVFGRQRGGVSEHCTDTL